MLKKAGLLTRPTPARQDASFRGQGRASEEARRTLRYVEPLNEARTPLADFFSILLNGLQHQLESIQIVNSQCFLATAVQDRI